MARQLVQVANVSKAFDGKAVLDDVSFTVNDGENMVVFGKSGTGKSVLLKCMVGLLKPDSGTVIIDDKNVLTIKKAEFDELRKKIGFLFQGAALYDSMSVRENLSFPLIRNFKIAKAEITRKVERALEMVSLAEAIDKMPSELSGGMRKRIGLARAIITEPMLMLYDEPTTGLDPITSKEISKLIRDLQRELKMTSIAITHDLVCAEIIADTSIMLKDGKIRFHGKLAELKESTDPFLVNFFSKEIFDDEGD